MVYDPDNIVLQFTYSTHANLLLPILLLKNIISIHGRNNFFVKLLDHKHHYLLENLSGRTAYWLNILLLNLKPVSPLFGVYYNQYWSSATFSSDNNLAYLFIWRVSKKFFSASSLLKRVIETTFSVCCLVVKAAVAIAVVLIRLQNCQSRIRLQNNFHWKKGWSPLSIIFGSKQTR
jgi:hypothetical protein